MSVNFNCYIWETYTDTFTPPIFVYFNKYLFIKYHHLHYQESLTWIVIATLLQRHNLVRLEKKEKINLENKFFADNKHSNSDELHGPGSYLKGSCLYN